jgi:phosphatidate cytidylyltransferase
VLPREMAILALGALVLTGAWEWAQLAGISGAPGRAAYVAACAAAMAILWSATTAPPDFERAMLLTMLGWIPLFAWIVLAPGVKARGLAAVAGLWALAPTWVALARLYVQDGIGRELVVFVLLLAWAADIGAYFAGRRFGRMRLAPVVSPNKTWEGVLGGLVAGFIVALAGRAWFDLPAEAFLPLCVAAVLVSVIGDLLESMFKRQQGLKDSGGLLPGHGGMLDRIDSLTSSVPLLALGLAWLGLLT